MCSGVVGHRCKSQLQWLLEEGSAKAVEGVGCHGNIIGRHTERFVGSQPLKGKQGMVVRGQQHHNLSL